MFGSHLSIAGSLLNALREAESLGLDTVQIFTKNQQRWTAKPLDPEEAKAWRSEAARLGWEDRMASHASYLPNLASPDDELWRKSIDLMHDEIERCEALGVRHLVHHPGAYTSSTLDEGLRRIAAAYRELFARTPGYRTVSCLENTAGGGTTIGRTFDELARLRGMIVEAVGGKSAEARVGYCIDTCHAFAGGYDLSSAAGAAATLDELGKTLGFEHVRVLHLNDSKGALGSRLDRHEHIGKGLIGVAGFAAVVNHQELSARPKIMETPKAQAPDGRAWDAVNLEVLKGLIGGEKKAARAGARSRRVAKA